MPICKRVIRQTEFYRIVPRIALREFAGIALLRVYSESRAATVLATKVAANLRLGCALTQSALKGFEGFEPRAKSFFAIARRLKREYLNSKAINLIKTIKTNKILLST